MRDIFKFLIEAIWVTIALLMAVFVVYLAVKFVILLVGV